MYTCLYPALVEERIKGNFVFINHTAQVSDNVRSPIDTLYPRCIEYL